MIVFASLQNFMSLLVFDAFGICAPNYSKQKYPYVRVGTLKPMRIKDILKTAFFCCMTEF